MNYLDIFNDKIILKKFDLIDKNNNNSFNHGLQHAQNVIDIMKKLVKLLKIGKVEENYLLIACALHDIGQLDGKENHFVRSKEYAKDYLKGRLDQEWYEKILLAIENHHEKEKIDDLTLFEHLVLFADKMDFSYKRLAKNYFQNNFEKHILNVDFAIKNNIFKVIIKTDQSITESDFKTWNYYSKIAERIKQFARKLKMDYEIEIV